MFIEVIINEFKCNENKILSYLNNSIELTQLSDDLNLNLTDNDRTIHLNNYNKLLNIIMHKRL